MKTRVEKGRRLIALVLAFMMVFTYMPFVQGTAYAESSITYTNVSTDHTDIFANNYGVVLSTDKAEYTLDENIYLKVEGSSAATSGGWIGIYTSVNSNDSTTSQCWAYTGSGTVSDVTDFVIYGPDATCYDGTKGKINTPLEAGKTYYIIHMSGGRWAVLPITITADSTDGEGTETPTYFTTEKTEFEYSEAINVTTTYDAASAHWVGIYKKGENPAAAGLTSIHWSYVSGNGTTVDINSPDNGNNTIAPNLNRTGMYIDDTNRLRPGEYTIHLFQSGYTSAYSVDITIKEHTVVTEATCETPGYTTVYAVDGNDYTKDDVAGGHTYSDWVYDEATGTHTRTCGRDATHTETENCDFSGDPIEEKEPVTETGEAGYKKYQCTTCEGVKTVEVPVDKYLKTDTQEPTCEEPGWERVYYEKSDGSEYYIENTINALGHAWGEWTPVGENPTTHTRVCENDATHVETGDCTTTDSYEGNKLVHTCSTCRGETADVLLSIDKEVYGVGEDINVTTYCEGGDAYWIGVFYGSDGGSEEEGTYPGAPSKGWVMIGSNPQTFTVNKYSTYSSGGYAADASSFFVNGTLITGDYTVAIIPGPESASGKAVPLVRFTVCAHSWSAWDVETAAKCESEGKQIATCSRCGETKMEVIPETGHDWNEGEVTKQASCFETGLKTVTCQTEGCGKTDEVEIPVIDHTWNDGEITKPSTCTTHGVVKYTCTIEGCGTTKEDDAELDSSKHEYQIIVTEPTCVAGGYTTYTCPCGQGEYTYVGDETPKLEEHNWDAGTETTAPTCITEGVKTYTCQTESCGKTETESIPVNKDNHKYNTDVIGPTCTEAGYTTHTCEWCSDSYTDSPVAALDHDWDKGTVTKVPTCTEQGECTKACQREGCGKTTPEPIDVDKDNHNYEDVVTAPTCTEQGYTTHTCTRCHGSYVDTYVDVEHKLKATVVAPTCDVDGYTLYKCECGTIEYSTPTGGKLGHKWDNGVETKAPTCTAEGVKTYTCNTCGDTKTEAIAKTKHIEAKTVITEATTSEDGKIIIKCTCGKVMSTETIYKVSIVQLSTKSYTYDGKKKSPSVIIKDSDGITLIEDTDYTLTTPSGRKNAGKYTYKIKFKGNYEGSKNLTLTIKPKKITKATLGVTAYTYSGKAKKPTVTVKAGTLTAMSKKTASNSNVTIKYATGRKNVGTYKVTITGKGNYTGTITKTFKINPKKTSVKSIVGTKKAFTVKWTKVNKQATGYEIMYATNSKFTKGKKTVKVTSFKTTSKKITKLKAKTTYYVKVRTYKTVKGVKYYSGWTTVKKIKTK